MNKLILTIAPTGNVPTKALNPYTPITVEEITNDVKACYDLGASIAHLHVRDQKGQPTSDRETYKQLLNALKDTPIIKQVSTGARGGKNTIDWRGQMLDLNCEMASLSTGSSNFPTSVNSNPLALVEALAIKMRDQNIKPEIEVFDVSMIESAIYLKKKGILNGPLHFNFVMNVPGSLRGTPKNLMFLHDSLPDNSTFTVSGIGKSQLKMLGMAIMLGGHVRTGLEDVLRIDNNHASNQDLVKQVLNIAKVFKRDLATPEDAKEILHL